MRSYLKISLVTVLLLALAVSFVLAKSSKDRAYAWLGVTTLTVNDDIADDHDLPIDFGALVLSVVDDSPAEQAGIEEDDIIISFNRHKVYDADDLSDYVEDSEPGEEVKITVYRDDRKVNFELTLDKRTRDRRYPSYSNRYDNLIYLSDDDDDYKDAIEEFRDVARSFKLFKAPKAPKGPKARRVIDLNNFYDENHYFHSGDRAYLGVYLTSLSGQLGDYFGVDKGRGALISEVVEGSPAEEAGLKAGDVIIAIDYEKVTDKNDAVELIGDYEPEDKVTVTFFRNKSKKEISVVLDENENYSDGAFYFNVPDISVNIPDMRGMQFGRYYENDLDEEYQEMIEEFIEALEDYEDEIDDFHGKFDKEFERELNRYMKKVEKFQKEYETQYEKEAERETKRAMKKLERELKRIEKLLD